MEPGKLDVSILYVEDDANARGAVGVLLKRAVRTVYTAENGKDGLELFKSHDPDIIITDIRMPVMDGLDMAREIKRENGGKPIIVTTAHSDTDYFMAAIEIGIDRYVLKPIDGGKLLSAIRKCAALLMHERELRKRDEERDKLIAELKDALARIRTLQGILPICASCKKIRDDKGYWNQIEAYIRDHSEAEFSHGICPDCAKKLYPEYYKP